MADPPGTILITDLARHHWRCDSIRGEHEYRLSDNRGSVPYFVLISGRLAK